MGQWKDHQRDGQGAATYADGSKYDGEWKDNKKNGTGTMTFANGTKHSGVWKDDVFDESKAAAPVAARVDNTSKSSSLAADLHVVGLTFNDSIGNKNRVLDAN